MHSPRSHLRVERLEDRLALSFLPADTYELTHWTYYVRAADFTGDGLLDLLAPSLYRNSVLPGNGDGTFGERIDSAEFGFGLSADHVAVGDFDFDGVLDVARSHLAGGVSIHRGHGDGTFSQIGRLDAGTRPSGMAADDFNADGVLDLVVNDWNHGTDQGYVNVLFGNGDGTFQPRQEYVAGRGTQHLAHGDVNLDGYLDVVSTNYYSNELTLFLNNGDGTFQDAVFFRAGSSPRGAVVTDVNFDGAPDLVVANLGSNSVSVFLGYGDGTFAPPEHYAAGRGPGAVAVDDFNLDGVPDFAVTNYFGVDLTVFLGYGDGTFVREGDYPTHIRCTAVIAADLNYDGWPDLVVVDGTDQTAYVLLNAGDWHGDSVPPGGGGWIDPWAFGELTPKRSPAAPR